MNDGFTSGTLVGEPVTAFDALTHNLPRFQPLAYVIERRRWESNPLRTGLQPVAWPFGSSVKYPRQESNLIPDLRRVVCDPPHPEDQSQQYPDQDSNPERLVRSEV